MDGWMREVGKKGFGRAHVEGLPQIRKVVDGHTCEKGIDHPSHGSELVKTPRHETVEHLLADARRHPLDEFVEFGVARNLRLPIDNAILAEPLRRAPRAEADDEGAFAPDGNHEHLVGRPPSLLLAGLGSGAL